MYDGFKMCSGVRQGCPLSPLLYALAADALLETIATRLPAACVHAYADDTAMILSDFWTDVPILAEIFEQFETISDLHLNDATCNIILSVDATATTTR